MVVHHQYARDVVGIGEDGAGFWLQASLTAFLLSRFVMTYLLGIFRPTGLPLAMGVLGVVFALTAVLAKSIVGLIATVGISVSLSLTRGPSPATRPPVSPSGHPNVEVPEEPAG